MCTANCYLVLCLASNTFILRGFRQGCKIQRPAANICCNPAAVIPSLSALKAPRFSPWAHAQGPTPDPVSLERAPLLDSSSPCCAMLAAPILRASSNRGGQLRIPIRIDSEYVRQGDEQRLFPRIENYLTRAEVAEAWPGGVITHESFTHRGFSWRMHSGRAGGPSSPLLWLAVLDGDSSAYPTGRKSLSMGQTEAAASGQRAPTSPCSRPLVDLELDGSPGAMSMRPFSPATSPATSTGGWLHQQNAMQLRHAGMSMVVAQSQSQNKFIEDLLTAESSHNAMERCAKAIDCFQFCTRKPAWHSQATPCASMCNHISIMFLRDTPMLQVQGADPADVGAQATHRAGAYSQPAQSTELGEPGAPGHPQAGAQCALIHPALMSP